MERRSCYSKKLLNMYHKSRSPHFWFSVQLFVVLQMGAAVLGQISNEALALLALKSSINDPGGHLENWVQQQQGGNGGVSTSPCTWTGITCNSNMSSVISLNLSTMNLSGSVSGDLGNLPNLLNISLDCNNFTGELPPQILSLSALQYFNISNNNFSNPFLSNFSQLQNLQVGSGSVGTRRSKCLSVSFRPSFLPSLPLCACVRVCFCLNFVFFCVFGERQRHHHSFTIFLSKQDFTKFSSSLAVAFLLLLDVLQYLLLWVCLFVCFASSNPCMKLGMRLGTVLLLPITNLHGLSESFPPGLSACSLFVLFVHLLFGSFENGLLCAGSANFFTLFVTGLMSMHFVQLVQC